MEPQNYGNVIHVCMCILHESRFMEPQNHGNLVAHVYVCNMQKHGNMEPCIHDTCRIYKVVYTQVYIYKYVHKFMHNYAHVS